MLLKACDEFHVQSEGVTFNLSRVHVQLTLFTNMISMEITLFTQLLTDLCQIEFSIIINWMSPCPILDFLVDIFTFYLFLMNGLYVNSIKADQILHFRGSDLSIHCLPMFHKKDARLTQVKHIHCIRIKGPLPIHQSFELTYHMTSSLRVK